MSKAWMTTFTGKAIDVTQIRAEDIDIVDIAHHLALVNRFGGATAKPLSVAQHSVYVARLVPPHMQLQALLHDATEAYMGDIIHWLKQTKAFDEYRVIEARLEVIIWEKFGCDPKMHFQVRDADRLMCVFEAEKLMPGLVKYPGYPELTENNRKAIGRWAPWNWKTAEEVFLAEARMRGIKC